MSSNENSGVDELSDGLAGCRTTRSSGQTLAACPFNGDLYDETCSPAFASASLLSFLALVSPSPLAELRVCFPHEGIQRAGCGSPSGPRLVFRGPLRPSA